MRTSSLVALVALFGLAGCGGLGNGGAPMGDMVFVARDMSAICGGGPKMGAADSHCIGDGGLVAVPVDASQCGSPPGGDVVPVYGATLFGTSGYDDGCKYLVSYKVSPICEGRGVTFTVIVKNAVDGTPVTGAKTRVEVTLDETHSGPAIGQTTTELAPGVYDVGPVDFDGTGTWVARFHFFDECSDEPSSPRGQAAFFITVQ